MRLLRLRHAGLAALVAAASPLGAAAADGDLFSPERFTGILDVRAALADGERSWLDGGFGKARFGGADDGFKGDGELAEASLVWAPRFTWTIDGYVHAQFNEHQNSTIDLVEAYARFRPLPRDGWRLKGRVGLFYPPVSLEHEMLAWGTRYSITPSAINSWIGEEVKVAGGEAGVSRDVGGHELGFTAAAFGRNDTSGTLLSWRGWALHDVKVGWDTDLPLPDGAVKNLVYFLPWQAPANDPHRELDDRVGFYGRADWRAPELVSVNVVHYDNAGARRTVEDGHYAWETRFTDIGLTLDLSPETLVLAQAMTGETIMGRRSPWRVDVGFSSAYVLGNHAAGPHSFTARADWFETSDRTFVQGDDNNEDGWAYMFAYGRELNERHRLMLEALHVTSDRPARAHAGIAETDYAIGEAFGLDPVYDTFGIDPSQDQTVIQASWRITL